MDKEVTVPLSGPQVSRRDRPTRAAFFVYTAILRQTLVANARTLTNDKGAFKLRNAKKDQSIIVRKAGFLPETLSVVAGQKKYDNITLKRDPIENKIDEIMAGMTIDDMIAQMTQAKVPKLNCGEGVCGSALEGGGAYTADFYKSAWSQKIPATYEAAIEQGALSVMASFSQVNGIHQHIDSTLLTGVLKTELAFDGYVIADWEGIEHSTTPGAAGNYFAGEVTDMSSKDAKQIPINKGDGKTGLYPYGYGLTY